MGTLNLKNDKYEPLEKVYAGNENDFEKIKKPSIKKHNYNLFYKIVYLIIIISIFFGIYFIFFNKKDNKSSLLENWYSVKLVNGEVYFGQVDDLNSDPINLMNVYYNYDQKKSDPSAEEDKNLRLVKRGQETHGPTGTMNIIRNQILYLEPLKSDSKVLNAILNYEK